MDNNVYREHLRRWITEKEFDLAATFTFKKPLDLEISDKFMQNFYIKIDRCLYGNASYRFNKRIMRVNFAEKGVRVQKRALLLEQTDGRLHIHSAIKMPVDRFSKLDSFSEYLNTTWHSNSKLAGRAKFVNIYDDNWIHYITKQTAAAECDAFLVNSSFIA